MAYDPAGPYVVLFGGENAAGVPQGATWTFSAGVWTEVCASCGPAPRFDAAMTFDAYDHFVLLFGGEGAGGPLNDSWFFKAGVWTQVCAACGPSPRTGAALAFDTVDNEVVLVGGCSVALCPLDDSWSFVGRNWSLLCQPCAFPARTDASLAYDDTDGYLMVFGGQGAVSGGLDLNDTWFYFLGKWVSACAPCGPALRADSAMSEDSEDGYVLLFGGFNATTGNGPLGDTWDYVNGTWHNVTLATSPSPREGAEMADDPAAHEVLLYGGSGVGGGALADTWSFDYGMSATTPYATPAQVENGQATTFTTAPTGAVGYAKYRWIDLPSGCSSQNVSSLPCTPAGVSLNSTFPVQVLLTDASGDTVLSGTLYFSVLANPAVPTVSASPPSVDSGQTVALSALANGGTGAYSFQWSGLPPPCVTANVRVLSCTPTGVVTNTTFMVQANITDSDSVETHGTPFPFVVDQDPTVATPIPSVTAVEEGQWLNLSTSGSAGAGGYTWTWNNAPTGCPTSNTPDLDCVVTEYDINTSVTFSVTLTDANGFSVTSSSTTVGIIVGPTTSAPEPSPAVIDSGQPVTWKVIDAGGVGGYSYLWTGLPPGCSSVDLPVFTCTPSAVSVNSTFAVSIQLTDANHQSVTRGPTLFQVSADPSLTRVVASVSALDSGQSVEFDVVASAGTPGYSFLWTGLPTGCISVDLPRWVCRPSGIASNTTFYVNVTVTDSDHVQATSGPVEIAVKTSLSVGTPIATPGALDAGQTVLLTAAATGGAGGYTFLWSGLPAGCSSSNAPDLTCKPGSLSSNATYDVLVNVTDALGASVNSGVVDLVVDAQPEVLGVRLSLSPIDLGSTLEATVSFSGGTGPYSFAWTGVPPGCPSTSGPELTCSVLGVGTFTLNATVVDGRQGQGGGPGAVVKVVPDPTVVSFRASTSTFTLGANTTLTTVLNGGVGPYAYTYQGLPSGCVSENLSQLLCTPRTSGTFEVVVNATDARGVVGSASLVLVVTGNSEGKLFGLPAAEAYVLIGAAIAGVVILFLVVIPLLRGELFAPAKEEDLRRDGTGAGDAEPFESPPSSSADEEQEEEAEEAPAPSDEPEEAQTPEAEKGSTPSASEAEPVAEASPEVSTPTPEDVTPTSPDLSEEGPGEGASEEPDSRTDEGAAPKDPSARACPLCGGSLTHGSYCPHCDVDFSQLRIEGRTDTLKGSTKSSEPPPGPT